MDIKTKVYQIVAKIPVGRVATYGLIARLASTHPRAIGRLLHLNDDPIATPCHRVVNWKGNLSRSYRFGGIDGQAKRLRAEGVSLEGEKIELKKYLWETR